LRVHPNTTCTQVRDRAKIKIAEIEEKIRALERMKTALTKLAAKCRGEGPTSECPILEALSESSSPE
jgi:MerR family copper efflux transcriptional regulator